MYFHTLAKSATAEGIEPPQSPKPYCWTIRKCGCRKIFCENIYHLNI